MTCVRRLASLCALCAVVMTVTMATKESNASQLRQCQPPQVDVTKLYGKNPREVRALLSPVLGPPTVETNQLPDGGAFARLDLADQQDGVSQRYLWGGTEGSIEVVYQRGRAHLVSVRLEEFETVVRSRNVMPCKPWAKDALTTRVGLKLPKKAASSRQTRGQVSFRFDLHGAPKQADWVARVRCFGNEQKCIDVSLYFPLHTPPGDEAYASMQVAQTPQPVLEAPPPPPSGERRPLKTD